MTEWLQVSVSLPFYGSEEHAVMLNCLGERISQQRVVLSRLNLIPKYNLKEIASRKQELEGLKAIHDRFKKLVDEWTPPSD